MGAKVAIGFSSIFWNTAWTNNQAPHTLGILCDPKHSLFNEFPTEFHSNWHWWDPVTHSQAMILDKFPGDLHPLIQPLIHGLKTGDLPSHLKPKQKMES